MTIDPPMPVIVNHVVRLVIVEDGQVVYYEEVMVNENELTTLKLKIIKPG